MTTGSRRCLPRSGGPPTELFNTWNSCMNYSIRQTILRLFAPQHRLSCSWLVWRTLLTTLRLHGQNGRRESGAFLLGRRTGEYVRIVRFVPYDDLDPNCLDTGIVRFDGRFYSALWEL